MNGRLLAEFSRRTTDELRAALPMRFALAALEPFLNENVAKEARKDALVIRRAAAALAAGAPPPGPDAARELLGVARGIDREFLTRVGAFASRIEIRYDNIEPLRLQRIALGLDTAYRILEAWRRRSRLREAFTPRDMERRLFEILRLYAQETQALSQGVQLPRILAPVRERIAQRLQDAMLRAAKSLSRAAAVAVQKG